MPSDCGRKDPDSRRPDNPSAASPSACAEPDVPFGTGSAVLQIPELEVIERHEHSNKVTYIEQGKDAAVAYGSYDFKFKNNTQNTLKLVMENTEDEVKAKIIKLI